MPRKQAALIEKARLFISDPQARKESDLRAELAACTDGMEDVLGQIFQPPPAPSETGLILDRPFRLAELAARYVEERMVLHVPADYQPEKPRGLVIFLHGGGRGQPRDTPCRQWRQPEFGVQDLFMQCGQIVCMPPSPPDEESHAAWNQHGVDDYIRDVIREVEAHYAIDPHRIYLAGHSMGGMGVMHLAQRMPDRFASVFASASCWDFGFWPVVEGLDFWFAQGINDAVFARRRHGTDVGFTRLLHRRLSELGLPHTYREHPGGHALFDGRRALGEWLDSLPGKRRDPFHPHCVIVSPRGCSRWINWKLHRTVPDGRCHSSEFDALAPAPHLRWLSVGDALDDTLCFDQVFTTACGDWAEEDWDHFEVRLKRKQIRAAMAEAFLCGRDVIELTARNTREATLWLHPSMVDFDRLRVILHGQEARFEAPRPNLLTALESYLRHFDRGMMYPAKLTFAEDQWWRTRNQIGG